VNDQDQEDFRTVADAVRRKRQQGGRTMRSRRINDDDYEFLLALASKTQEEFRTWSHKQIGSDIERNSAAADLLMRLIEDTEADYKAC
jgi:hypothetical protein